MHPNLEHENASPRLLIEETITLLLSVMLRMTSPLITIDTTAIVIEDIEVGEKGVVVTIERGLADKIQIVILTGDQITLRETSIGQDDASRVELIAIRTGEREMIVTTIETDGKSLEKILLKNKNRLPDVYRLKNDGRF